MKKLIVFLLIAICPLCIWANMAAPSQGGNSLSEPGGIKNIDIIRENLTVDFTQLGNEDLPASERSIDVRAVYEINSAIDIEKLELVFVIASEANNFQFFLDDTQLVTEPVANEKFANRETWKTPQTTPFEGKELMYNPYNGNLKSAKFSLKLSKGKHTLKALYKAKPTVYANLGAMKGWQFAYSLAPARDWKSFGGLDLNIKIPNDWKFDSNVKLDRDGGILSGKFAEIPADYLAVTTQLPLPANYNTVSDTLLVLFFVCLVLVPLLMIGLAFWKGWKWRISWLYGLLFGLLWAALVGLSGYLYQVGADSLIPKGQFISYGYGDAFGVLFLIIFVPVILVVGILLWVAAVSIAAKVFDKAKV